MNGVGRPLSSSPNWGAPGSAIGSVTPVNGTFLALAGTTYAGSGTATITITSVGATRSDGLVLVNTTPATSGNQKYSPGLRLTGQGYGTSGAASQQVDWFIYTAPAQSSNATCVLMFDAQRASGGWTNYLKLTDEAPVVFTGTNGILYAPSQITFPGSTFLIAHGGAYSFGDGSGHFYIGFDSIGTISSRALSVSGISNSFVHFTLTGISSQTVDFVQIKNNSSVLLFNITSAGAIGKYNGDTTAGNGLASVPQIVSLTGQTASIAATNMFLPPVNGMYRVSVYLEDTTASTSGGTVTVNILYSDDNGSQTQSTSALLLSLTGFTSNTFVLFAKTSAQIQYSTTVAGTIVGSPQYALRISVERMS